MKRYIALFLTLAMLVGLCPTAVWAEAEDYTGNDPVPVIEEDPDYVFKNELEVPTEDNTESVMVDDAEYVSESAVVSTPLTNSVASIAEARWGVATGEKSDQAPTSWTTGTLDEAETYANGLETGTAYIQLLSDVDTTSALYVNQYKFTVLDLNGHTIDRGLTEEPDSYSGSVIVVYGDLTLCDSSTTDVTKQGKITGGYDSCGGVFLHGIYGANLTMNGGNISENNGGGVHVDRSTFTMNGGNISGNTAEWYGGGVSVDIKSTFTMNGGTISGNTAERGGGVSVVQYRNNGSFTMTGGTISENTADYGGGVYISDGSFFFDNGTISGNTAEWYGGGVAVNSGSSTVIMEDGSISKNITTGDGGGVAVMSGSFIMNGGCISKNTGGFGGGVGIEGSGNFTMSGGIISENTAGGGVHIEECFYGGAGSFTMSGGAITENYDGGVYVGWGSSFEVSGAPVINDNLEEVETYNGTIIVEKNVTLSDNGIISVGVLTSGASIGVSGGKETFTSGGAEYADDGYFFSDSADYRVADDENGNLMLTDAPSSVIVTFNANGGSGTMSPQTVPYNKATALNANAFTRTNYQFAGWNTKADGTGTAYSDRAIVKLTSGITLYAQWSIEARWGNATGTNSDEQPTSWINGTLADAMTYANSLASGTAYIQLLSDVDTTEPLVFDEDTITILDLNGKTIDRGLRVGMNDDDVLEEGYVISIWGDLTLCDTSSTDVTKQGMITGGGNSGVMVSGFYVEASFKMNGGNIYGNYGYDGGGVYVGWGSSFTMNGGSISGNTSIAIEENNVYTGGFGGGVSIDQGCFTMNGGLISGNTTEDFGDGGGVLICDGIFTMNGGTITGNAANCGGGVCNLYGIITINSGTISGNTVLNNGGGVCLSGKMNISGAVKITGNTASSKENNVYIYEDSVLNVGVLNSVALIGVTKEGATGTFSVGGADYADDGYFISDNPAYVVEKDDDGNLQLVDAPAEARWGLATGADSDQTPTTWVGNGTLVEAVTYANSLESDTAYIQLLKDVKTTATLTFEYYAVLDLNGYDIDRGLSETESSGDVVEVYRKLTLCDTSSNDVTKQGIITGGNIGVYNGKDATIIMNGGVISGNSYAGVSVGAFIMNGGVISENSGRYGVRANWFTMNGGIISENAGYGVDCISFTINDGIIENNARCGVSASGLFFEAIPLRMNGGSITGNGASDPDYQYGGVHIGGDGVFTMTGGTISGNTASSGGGGVYVNHGSFNMSGGSITGNTASSGGGVYISYGTFTMNDGTISGNTASDGGGVLVASDASFIMNGGTVSENVAYSCGGGVQVFEGSFTMSDGVIAENTAKYGGGVSVDGGTFKVTGTPVITENTDGTAVNNVYMWSGKTIAVETLSSGTSIGVTMAEKTGTFTAGGADYADDGYFVSDIDEYLVVANGQNLKLKKIGAGATLSGTVGNYGSEGDAVGDVTIELWEVGATEASYSTVAVGSNPSYSISGVVAGTYMLRISKAGHVTREYTVVISDEDVTQDAKICPKGDMNLDGEVNADDLTVLARHVAKIEGLTDDYALLSADVDNNGSLSADDLTKLARYVAKIIPSL